MPTIPLAKLEAKSLLILLRDRAKKGRKRERKDARYLFERIKQGIVDGNKGRVRCPRFTPPTYNEQEYHNPVLPEKGDMLVRADGSRFFVVESTLTKGKHRLLKIHTLRPGAYDEHGSTSSSMVVDFTFVKRSGFLLLRRFSQEVLKERRIRKKEIQKKKEAALKKARAAREKKAKAKSDAIDKEEREQAIRAIKAAGKKKSKKRKSKKSKK